MKITFGRKFLGVTIATVLLVAIYFVTLFSGQAIVNATVTLAFGGFIMFLWVGYIGGNMFTAWAKGKYFQAELVGK